MDLVPTPEILAQQSALIQMMVWVFSLIVVGLSTALTILWRAKEDRDKYIRSQDKANLEILNELVNNYKLLGLSVSKIENSLDKLTEIKHQLNSLENKFKK